MWSYAHTRSINSNTGKVCICFADIGVYYKMETIFLPLMIAECDFGVKKRINEIIWFF